MFFKVIGEISEVQTIAAGKAIRDVRRLRKYYSGRRWRKMKGIAKIELPDGTIYPA